jgi:hypothetical protein
MAPEQGGLFGDAASSKRGRGRPPGAKNKPKPRPSVGRVERALGSELRDSALPGAAKAHLRAAAFAVDVAETALDVLGITKAVLAYLELRQAYGLAGSKAEALDPFAAFVAGMGVAERQAGE